MSDLLNSASLVMIPSGYKEDVVYSQIPTDGSGDLSFTRASNGTRVNSAGLVEEVPWNLAIYSEDLSNAAWTKARVTITANDTTAPNGTLTADKVSLNSGTNSKLIQQVYNQNGAFTQSVYAKAGTHNFIQLLVGSDTTPYCNFDLVNGTYSASGCTASITSVGNGWFYLTMSYSTTIGTDYYLWAVDSLSSVRADATSSTGYYYAWGYQLNIGSTAKPYFPTTDRLNVPRLTYQNGGGGCPSLLLEKQSTNLALYSQEFDNAYWTKTRSTISANQAISPDGTQNADKLIEDAVSGTHFADRTISGLTASAVHSFSIFAKKGEREFVNVQCVTTGNSVYINLNNGAITISGGYTSSTVQVESHSNSWYRITVNDTPVGTSLRYIVVTAIDSTTNSYSGNGTSGIYIYGAQLEASSYATSYIPTTSSSATRVADECYKTGISSLIGQTEGTIFVDFVVVGIGSNNINIYNNDRTANTISTNAILFKPIGSIECQTFLGNGTFNTISITASTYTVGQRIKLAYRYKSGDFALYINGIQKATATNTMTFVGTKSQIYLDDNAVVYAYQESVQYNQFVQFPTALTNAELQALTA